MPEQYAERVRGALDALRTHEKDRLILGFIAALYPAGDPDHPCEGAVFLAEAIRLLAAFHPSQLQLPAEKEAAPAQLDVPEF